MPKSLHFLIPFTRIPKSVDIAINIVGRNTQFVGNFINGQ
jgi:hypothetical protein